MQEILQNRKYKVPESAGVQRDSPGLTEFYEWLEALAGESHLTAKGKAVVHLVSSQPQRASYDSAAIVGDLARVNVATVTRTAQSLGFTGWPALQQELRARYLACLSAPEVADVHETHSPFQTTLQRDIESLNATINQIDAAQIQDVIDRIATARRNIVVASGSFSSVGHVLAHNGRLAGYEFSLESDSNAVANAIAAATTDDVVIVISFWRLYENAVRAARSARDKGVFVIALTDATSGALAKQADLVLPVPAESAGFFPSVSTGVSVASALVSELARRDPPRTRASIERAEKQWNTFELLHKKGAAGGSTDEPKPARTTGD